MERGNSKHGPRVDDQMTAEVDGVLQGTAGSRVEEWHQPEPPADGEPEPGLVPGGELRTGSPQGMSSTDVEQRSRLGRYIDLSALPGDRESLLLNAAANGAPDDVLAELNRLPADAGFQTVSEVWAALGHRNETRRW
jgi:hypothetical protein